MSSKIEVFKLKSAFKNRVRSYVLRNKNHIDPTEFFKNAFVIFKHKIRKSLVDLHTIKVHMCFTAKFKRISFASENESVSNNVANNNAIDHNHVSDNTDQNNQSQGESSNSRNIENPNNSANNDNDDSSSIISQNEIDSESYDGDDDSSEKISQSELYDDESENDITKMSFNGDDDSVNDTDIEGHHNATNNIEIFPFYLQTKSREIIATTNLHKWFKSNVIDSIMSQIDQLQENGSGWALHEIIDLTININKHVMFSGSCYIPLPSDIDKNKKSIVNVQNNDSKCFLWSVLASLHPKNRMASKVDHYKKYEKELSLDGITFPVSLNDIQVFERKNEDISINVYVIVDEFNHEKKKSEKVIVPVRLTDNIKSHHIHLLMLHENNESGNDNDGDSSIESDNEFISETNEYDDYVDESDNESESENRSSLKYLIENYDAKFHYCWIKNLSALIQAQVTEVNRSKKHICDRCLNYFYTKEKLINHISNCKQLNECKVTLPTEEHKWVKFNNHQFKLENQFIVYADIESLLTETSEGLSQPKGAYEEHKAFSVGYYFHSRCSKLKSFYKSYTSDVDAVDWFVKELHQIAKDIWRVFHECEKMKMSESEIQAFKAAIVCHICEKPFDFNEDEGKVRDHDHFTGKFR